jgi:hypothetical protein
MNIKMLIINSRGIFMKYTSSIALITIVCMGTAYSAEKRNQLPSSESVKTAFEFTLSKPYSEQDIKNLVHSFSEVLVQRVQNGLPAGTRLKIEMSLLTIDPVDEKKS